MKAVILAGGEGTRLRPLTLERCKPMVSLFGRPVLEHILLLLRKNGFDQVAVTLGYLPQSVRDYFGDGSEWGMQLHYYEEKTPLGTAGAVKQTADFLGEEDFIVISGDCVCDFDLQNAYQRHVARGAVATLLLHREKDPLEYGLVRLDEAGRVDRFLEKPGWGEVFTNLVNTGIYVLSPGVLERVPPEGAFDFSRELFPALMKDGIPIYGDVPYGYWRDMGDTRSYLKAAADALDGKVKLSLGLPQVRAGVWSASPLPESCAVVPPCWIGARVTVGEQCLLGPHTVLEQGSFLGDRTVAQRSVLLGAAVGSGSTLHGAILCEDASVGDGCTLAEGTVLGAQACLEDHVMLREEVRIWPRIPVRAGSRLSCSVTGGAVPARVFFERGAIRGRLAREITPELLLTLGSVLGREERVALGCTPGPGSAALLMAAAAGVSAAGSTPWVHDGTTWGAASWFALREQVPCGLFIEVEGEQCRLWVMDGRGMSLSTDQYRRIEGVLRRQEIHRASAGAMGRQEQARGVDEAYCLAAAKQGNGMCRLTVSVPEDGRENRLLANALRDLGCKVLGEKRRGVPAFWVRSGGRLLFAEDERGTGITPEQLMLLVMLELGEGGGEEFFLSWDAPAASRELAQRLGCNVLSAAAAREHALRQIALRDGVFAACLLCRRLSRSERRLSEVRKDVPGLGTVRGELTLDGSRGDVMEAIARQWPQGESGQEGLRLHVSGGWVWIRPAADRAALKIRTEAKSVELAAQLCDFVRSQAKKLDHGEK